MGRAARSGAGWSTGGGGDNCDGGDDGDGGAGAVGARSTSDGDPHPFDAVEAARYREGAELGQGGMGRVVAARDLRLGREVALKSVVGSDHGAGRRFAREALITAALDHPSIVPILDAGRRADGSLFYTMRLVRGRTLGTALREAGSLAGRLGLLRHFLLACEAVAYAHDHGVVHRDLKPDNILVGAFGETQVADWGLARRIDHLDAPDGGELDARAASNADAGSADGDLGATSDPALTVHGALLGTPAYMSPEQADRRQAGPASDVWSLGVVLHELLAGAAPFQGSDSDAVLAAVRAGQLPSLARIQPDAPAELVAIVDKALRVDPTARYPDARALAADLERFLDGRLVSAHRYSPREHLLRVVRAWRAPLLVGAVATLLLLATGALAWWRTGTERDRALLAEQEARLALAESDHNLARSLTDQALGLLAAGGRREAELLAARSLRLGDLPEARGVLAAFGRAGRAKLIERTPPPCERPRPIFAGSLAVLCVEGGEVSVHEGHPLRQRWRRAMAVQDGAWLAGGTRLVVSTDVNTAHILDAVDGHELTALGRIRGAAGWTGSGSEVALLFNPTDVTIIDTARATVRLVNPCGAGATHATAAVTPDGDTVVVGCRNGVVHLFDRAGVLQRSITATGEDRSGPAAITVSPDGALLVVTTLDGDGTSIDLRGDAPPLRMPLGMGEVAFARFSPDGRTVLLLSERGGPALWDPRARATPFRISAEHDRDAALSADGHELVLSGSTLRRFTLPDRPRATRVQPERDVGVATAATSSDGGSELALALGNGRLVVLDADTGRVRFTDRFQEGVLKGVQILPGGAGLLAWAAGSPSLRTYDHDGHPQRTLDLSMVRRAARLPSGWLVGAIYGNGAQLIPPDWHSGDPHPLRLGTRPFLDFAQSSDASRLLLLDQEGSVWQVDDGAPPTARPLLKRAGAHALALSDDGKRLALCSNSAVEVLDMSTLATLTHLPSDGLRLLDVALSPDGALAAAADLDGSTRVWALRADESHPLRAVLHGHEGRVVSVAFAEHGRLLVTGSWDGSARLYDLTILDRPAAQLAAEVEADWQPREGVERAPHAQSK